MLTPSGQLQLAWAADLPRPLQQALESASTDGERLLFLAGQETDTVKTEELQFWRGFARDHVAALCRLPGFREGAWVAGPAVPSVAQLQAYQLAAPPVKGMEYLTVEKLADFWQQLSAAFSRRAQTIGADAVLHSLHPSWRAVGRITLHLAENPRDLERPFAFLATYVKQLNARGEAEHLPLGKALKELAQDAVALRSLLLPLQSGAEASQVLGELVSSKKVFQAIAWTPDQAHAFLQELPKMEEAGLVVKVPDWWQGRRPPSPQVQVVLDTGEKRQGLGFETLLKFKATVALGQQELTAEELDALLHSTTPLVSLKGRWIQPDRKKLAEALAFWHRAQQAHEQGIPFHQGLRWLAGWQGRSTGAEAPPPGSSVVQAGPQFSAWLSEMRAEAQTPQPPPSGLRATLRPYQQKGLDWLSFMAKTGLGACLADDMGLGKTLQVIALLLRRREDGVRGPSLIVAPASLLGSWQRELARFAPELEVLLVHRSSMGAAEYQQIADGTHASLRRPAVFITTYAQCGRAAGLLHTAWDAVVLDEAQTIKNAASQQAQHIRQLKATARIALTGTPIENRLTDLWSIFEFLNPGLLGGVTDFAIRCRELATAGSYAPLRQMVRPFILRRMKTDPQVAPDLPRKTEVIADCGLSKRQATLYQRAVNEMMRALKAAQKTGSEEYVEQTRKGIVLGMLLKLKQICDHPSLFSGDQGYAPEDSGKMQRLTEMAQGMADRQERLLVFTQFREMTDVLAQHLQQVFGRAGLVLHGGTPVGQRGALVEQFQQAGGPPFFVISVKAGGTGLTLTAASQVIHFDRWWNPAVEDQATDRAYRIGQTQPVMVHKMVTRGTLEQRIDQLLRDKKALQQEILGDAAEDSTLKLLTEMSDSELAEFVSLSEDWENFSG